jgi:hypothetical protein
MSAKSSTINFGLRKLRFALLEMSLKVVACIFFAVAFFIVGLVNIQDLAPAYHSVRLVFVGIACILIGGLCVCCLLLAREGL